jgi:hypothetical protein
VSLHSYRYAWAERVLKCGYEQYGFIWNCFGPPGCLKGLFTHLPAAKITQINEFTPAAWTRVKAKDQAVAGPPDVGVTGIFSWLHRSIEMPIQPRPSSAEAGGHDDIASEDAHP